MSRKYLGTAGIHGVGLSRERNAVSLHVASNLASGSAEQMSILDSIRRDAAPYDLVVTVDETSEAGQ